VCFEAYAEIRDFNHAAWFYKALLHYTDYYYNLRLLGYPPSGALCICLSYLSIYILENTEGLGFNVLAI
jgi:hypothetical protein